MIEKRGRLVRQGIGQLIYKVKNGKFEYYHGEWENDFKHGQGTYHYLYDDIYEGKFLEGKFHGHVSL